MDPTKKKRRLTALFLINKDSDLIVSVYSIIYTYKLLIICIQISNREKERGGSEPSL